MTHLCIVIPVCNEEGNLPRLHEQIRKTLESRAIPYRMPFVNDESRDGSLPFLRTLAADDARVRVFSFSRNFGHQMAISAGLARSS